MYEAHLRSLLSPLGIYDLEEHSASGAAVCALGTGLDTVSRRLEEIEREALTATAEGEGLARREALFARRPAAVTAEERRAAIAALLQIDGDSLTPAAIDRTIRGCGIRARALEMGGGQLRVIFPEVAGEPEDFDQIRKIILDILPATWKWSFTSAISPGRSARPPGTPGARWRRRNTPGRVSSWRYRRSDSATKKGRCPYGRRPFSAPEETGRAAV